MAVKSYVDDDDDGDDENDGRMAKRSTTTNANERINGIYGDAKHRDPSRVVASSLPYRLFPRLIRQSMVCEKCGRCKSSLAKFNLFVMMNVTTIINVARLIKMEKRKKNTYRR